MANVPISAFTVPINTKGIGLSGYSLTGSSALSVVDLAGSWSTTGAPTAIKLNLVDNQSDSSSLLLDLQIGSSSKFKVDKTGATTTRDINITRRASLTGQATSTIQSLAEAASISWDCDLGAKAKVLLSADRAMAAVTNAIEGTSYALWVVQDGIGSHTLTWASSGTGSFDFGADLPPTLSYTGNTADLLAFEAVTINTVLKLRFVGIKRGFT